LPTNRSFVVLSKPLEHAKRDRLIAGKYQLVKELGRGTMGSVWEAWHLSLRSPVAIKLMAPSIAASPTALQRFLREARAAAGLRSPHVVQILDHGVDQGLPYIVMEKLEGEALAERLARVGRLSLRETSRLVTHVARALTRAQQAGITHRDLKPENVFLVRNDDEELVKVLDFGVAKVEQRFDGSFNEESTAAGALLGTPYYASPEQAEGLKSVDHRTDIWSLGVMAFECLLGRRPFEGETLPAVLLAISSKPLPIPSQMRLGAVPRGFDAWFAKACARDLTDRFAFAKDMASELARICAEHPGYSVPAVPETRPLLGKLPPLAPLPALPKLGGDDDDDDDDEAPTEIWREDAIADLVGKPRVSSLPPPSALSSPSSPRPTLPPIAPLTTVAALRPIAQLPARRPRSRALLAALPALGVAGFGWFFYGERLAHEGVAVPRPRSTAVAVVSAAPALPSSAPPPVAAVPPPAPELMPTVDVKSLPLSVPARLAPRPRKPPPRATPEKEPQGDGEDIANPYR
jgi:serine/threonine protein kinase